MIKIGVVKEMIVCQPIMRVKTKDKMFGAFCKGFIKDVDLDLKRIDIHYMEGLFENIDYTISRNV